MSAQSEDETAAGLSFPLDRAHHPIADALMLQDLKPGLGITVHNVDTGLCTDFIVHTAPKPTIRSGRHKVLVATDKGVIELYLDAIGVVKFHEGTFSDGTPRAGKWSRSCYTTRADRG